MKRFGCHSCNQHDFQITKRYALTQNASGARNRHTIRYSGSIHPEQIARQITQKLLPVFLLFASCFAFLPARSQEANNRLEDLSGVFEQIIEPLTESSDEEVNSDQIYTDLEWLVEHPIELNHATYNDLEQLPFMNPVLIHSFFCYREQIGQFTSLYELQLIEGFSIETARNLALFSTLSTTKSAAPEFWRHELSPGIQFAIEPSKGFLTDSLGLRSYPGPRPRILLRYKGSKGDRFRWNFTAENDPGEPFFRQNNRWGFDFYSAGVFYQGAGLIRSFGAGDYQVKLGQGLIFWTGYGKQKSTETTGIRYTGQGIQLSGSTDENRSLRGLAGHFQFRQTEVLVFYSHRKKDANIIDYESDSTVKTVSSIQTSGYHRTEAETEDENSLRVQTTGLSVQYRSSQFSTGINIVAEWYGADIEPPDKLYNQYAFKGKQNTNASVDFRWIKRRAVFFGEAAISRSAGTAIVAGVETMPCNRMNLSWLYRNYSSDFHSIAGSAFSDGNSTSNEEGFYLVWSVYPFPRISFSGYSDLYRSYRMRYQSLSPVRGFDTRIRTTMKLSNSLQGYIQYKRETCQEKSSLPAAIKPDVVKATSRLRVHLDWDATARFTGRFRVEYSGFSKDTLNDRGLLLFADGVLQSASGNQSVTTRISWFKTSGYNSRIYAYENDLPQSFSIPALYGHGLRTYVQLRGQISHWLTWYVRYSCSWYFDQSAIGSGDSLIDGNHRSDFKIMLRFRF